MKITHSVETPKYDFDDYTRAEQKLMMLMSGVQGKYETDYMGAEKAITIRTNVVNTPKVEALVELSKLSKNLVINDLLELAFHVLEENLKDEDLKRFKQTEAKKYKEWLSPDEVK